LTVKLTTPDASTATQAVTVSSTGAGALKISAGPYEGLQTFTMAFSLASPQGLAITHIDFSCLDDGRVQYTTTKLPINSVACGPYTGVGNGRARVSAYAVAPGQTTESLLYTDAWYFHIWTFAELDHIVRSTYINMFSRLKAGNINGALNGFTATAAPIYSAIFNAIGVANLPSAVDHLGSLQTRELSEGFADYKFIQSTPNGPGTFPIHILRATDGIWRIDSM
jgi:hypothetical protein